MTSKQRTIDSHIHLFGEPHLGNLAWMTDDNKLHGNNRLEEYQQITSESKKFESQGVVFLETDVKSGLSEDQWKLAINEYLYVERTVNQQQLPGEGSIDGSKLIKAIIPWAPLPLGPEGLSKYVEILKESTVVEKNWGLVKGFRYLFQDKPEGTMIEQDVIDGLNWLGSEGYTFDLGIDLHSRGIQQLEEFAIVDSKTSNVTYIVNHLCKPDFIDDVDLLEKTYKLWKSIAENNKNNYFIKLSGAFSELPQEYVDSDDSDLLISKVIPWVKLFYEIFGPKKIIWGSDWPVSTFKFPNKQNENPWDKWANVSEIICKKLNLELDEVFYLNATTAYKI